MTSLRATWLASLGVYAGSILVIFLLRSNYPAIDLWAQTALGIPLAPATTPPVIFADWLAYISPYGRIPEFVTGCLVGHLFVRLRDQAPSRREQALGIATTLLAIIYLLVSLSSEAMRRTPHSDVIYWAGMFPAMPILIFSCARYVNPFTKMLSWPAIVLLGDASYSIYMLHLIFIEATAAVPGTPLTFGNVVILGTRVVFVIGTILLAALGSYRYFEVPMRRWLRDRMTQSRSVPAYAVRPTLTHNDASVS